MTREGRSVRELGSPLDPGEDEHSLRHRTGKSHGNMRGGSDRIVLKVRNVSELGSPLDAQEAPSTREKPPPPGRRSAFYASLRHVSLQLHDLDFWPHYLIADWKLEFSTFWPLNYNLVFDPVTFTCTFGLDLKGLDQNHSLNIHLDGLFRE